MQEESNDALKGIQLYIGPIYAPRDVEIGITDFLNPGIGGSEFYFIRLAHELSLQGADVTLLSLGAKVNLENPNVRVVSKLPNFESLDINRSTLIASTSGYQRALSSAAVEVPLILVSHHPHDGDLASILKVRKDFLLINLGEYQHLSNNLRSVAAVILPVLTPPPSFRTNEPQTWGIVGHLSSLVPSKGFHHLAKAWRAIFRTNPGSRLVVIGGSSLYGFPENHPRIPTSVAYGKKIEKLLGSGIDSNSVEFLGVVKGSIEDRITEWTFAVLNPAGIAEADPSSVKDCMRKGIPVVGAFDYGMRRYLRRFPELQIRSPRKTAQVVNKLLSQPSSVIKLSEKIRSFYIELFEKNSSIIEGWTEIITGVSSSQNYALIAEKFMAKYQWEERLLFRIKVMFRAKFQYPLLQILHFIRSARP